MSEDITTSNYGFVGLPENYFNVPGGKPLDIDALHCALNRASGVCHLLISNFDGSGCEHSTDILCNTVWALQGLIDQSILMVVGGNEVGK